MRARVVSFEVNLVNSLGLNVKGTASRRLGLSEQAGRLRVVVMEVTLKARGGVTVSMDAESRARRTQRTCKVSSRIIWTASIELPLSFRSLNKIEQSYCGWHSA